MELNNTILRERLEHYLNLTKKAREKATPIPLKGTKDDEMLQILLRMADDYASDAKHFM